MNLFRSALRRSRKGTSPMGLTRVELVTSRLSGVRSNRLSYRPVSNTKHSHTGMNFGSSGSNLQHESGKRRKSRARHRSRPRRLYTPAATFKIGMRPLERPMRFRDDPDVPFTLKGGDPAALSSTATLLRLHPPYQAYLRHRPPLTGWTSDFGYPRLGWCDGRCVQGPGTYSPRHADARLLAIPPSRSRVSDSDPN